MIFISPAGKFPIKKLELLPVLAASVISEGGIYRYLGNSNCVCVGGWRSMSPPLVMGG